jgi:hypothetical protein
MACQKFNQQILEACKNSLPGVQSVIYIADKSYLPSGYFTTNTAGDSISGITISGTTKCFYKLTVRAETITYEDGSILNPANSVGLSKPKLTFKIAGWGATQKTIIDLFLKTQVVAAIQDMSGVLWAIGWTNGLDAKEIKDESGAFGGDAFLGATISLEGIEPYSKYIIPTTLNFVSTYVL